MSNNDEFVVGIDLGTTYSCISAYQNGKITIFDDELGNKTIASYVSFTDKEFLIGQGAKNLAPINGANTVYDVKRIIGRDLNDPGLQKDMKHFPFKIVGDEKNLPLIDVTYKGQSKIFKPEQISALILQKLRKMAEDRLGFPVKKAVITVPAYYGDAQRSATIAAGQIAGLEVIKILNEPTAAAFAYGIKQQQQGNSQPRNILVFDLGGGTFDVSILQLVGNDFKVLSTSGDAHLGGEDFDVTLMRFIMHTFKTKTSIDLEGNDGALRRLKRACEDAKIQLSSQLKTTISVDNITPGQDLQVELSRAKFEQLCNKYFQLCLPPVEAALKHAQLSKTQIDDIVLVGGSTRIPGIQKTIVDYFDGKSPTKAINPDEAVSIGAAVQAATLSKHAEQSMGKDNVIIQDVIPLDLGIAIVNDGFSVILPRNSAVPITKSQRYVTSVNYQTDMIIDILEGNESKASLNDKLGTVTLTGMPPKLAGQVSMDISFSYDENGVVSCNASVINNEDGTIANAAISFPKRSQISAEDLLLLKHDNFVIDNSNEDALSQQRLKELQRKLNDSDLAREEFRNAILRICKMIQDAGPDVLNNSKRATNLLLKIIELLQQIAMGNFNFTQDQIRDMEKAIMSEYELFILELRHRQRSKGLVPQEVLKREGDLPPLPPPTQ
jgi:L1 cell adhesion molecule like protein